MYVCRLVDNVRIVENEFASQNAAYRENNFVNETKQAI